MTIGPVGAFTPSTATFDLRVVGTGTVPWGDVLFQYDAPSKGILNQQAGQKLLGGTSRNVWQTISVPLSTEFCHAISTAADLSVRLTINLPAGSTVIVDNYRFGTGGGVGQGGQCNVTSECKTGLVCAGGRCGPPHCANQVKDGNETDVNCGGACPPCPSGKGCQNPTDCASGLTCSNGICVGSHCTNQTKDADETDVDCGGATCPRCPGGKGCGAPTDCATGLVCGTTNGACFNRARAARICWPATCQVGPAANDCGQPGSPCGANCDCATPCDPADPNSSTCPSGEECKPNLGNPLGTASRDACADPRCPTDDPALCGDASKLCGPCICTPNCSTATCQNSSDRCGGQCLGKCGLGDTCNNDLDCAVDATCLQNAAGARACRPKICLSPGLAPPDCGSPNSPCPECPVCANACTNRQCGASPTCPGVSCGLCNLGSVCNNAGQCRQVPLDPTPTVPDRDGLKRDLVPIPPVPGNPVGAIAAGFSVSELGSARYSIPIRVPPGRAGIEPALSLEYTGARAPDDAGYGWALQGLPKITRCPRVHAYDFKPAPIRNDTSDAFCLDGKRLVGVPGTGTYGGAGTEYRTMVDSFSKIVSFSAPGEGPLPVRGPEIFQVSTREGRILTFNARFNGVTGARHIWYLGRVEDRAGNRLDVQYSQWRMQWATLDLQTVLPLSITYTGHGDTEGDREVRFELAQAKFARCRVALRLGRNGETGRLRSPHARQDTGGRRAGPELQDRLHARSARHDREHRRVRRRRRRPVQASDDGSSTTRRPASTRTSPASGSGAPIDLNGDGLTDFMDTVVHYPDVDDNSTLRATKLGFDIAVLVATLVLPQRSACCSR